MPCKICGDPATIEAHIVPRALTRSVAADDQHALVGYTNQVGITFDGKGTFDRNLLCLTHERMLGSADDYGVNFLRNFESAGNFSLNDERIWLTPNPTPSLLTRFVAACVWRRAISPVRANGADLHLGVRAQRLTQFLFERTSFDPQLILCRRVLLCEGMPLPRQIMTEPHRCRQWSPGSWIFSFGTCMMILNLDYTRNRAKFDSLAANARNPAPAVNLAPAEAIDVGWADIILNMERGMQFPRDAPHSSLL